jgi:acetyl esterase
MSAIAAIDLPGRLADPSVTLGTDPRADPRIGAALAPFFLDGHVAPPHVTAASPRDAQLAFCAGAEGEFQAVLAALTADLPPVDGVASESFAVPREDGASIVVYVHRPARSDGPLPCVVHLHGGGMVMLAAADPVYARWRDELAAAGVVVVGVEFRNAAGKLGTHPFPAGLDDCVAAVRWVVANGASLGASAVIVSGESGGGNLTLALAHRAKREGWVDQLAGLYAQCPYISGAWAEPPVDLPSLRENDEYFVSNALFSVLMEVYDPGSGHRDDPTCWPLRATCGELEGLPPVVISVNELDPLRDEGIAYYRRLRSAGVSAIGRVVAGTSHGADVLLPGAIPDVHSASVRDLSGFARALV